MYVSDKFFKIEVSKMKKMYLYTILTASLLTNLIEANDPDWLTNGSRTGQVILLKDPTAPNYSKYAINPKTVKFLSSSRQPFPVNPLKTDLSEVRFGPVNLEEVDLFNLHKAYNVYEIFKKEGKTDHEKFSELEDMARDYRKIINGIVGFIIL